MKTEVGDIADISVSSDGWCQHKDACVTVVCHVQHLLDTQFVRVICCQTEVTRDVVSQGGWQSIWTQQPKQ